MKKVTTKIRFIDSKSKEYISRKLKDACERAINDYNEDAEGTIVSPVLRVGKFENGDWDTNFQRGMTNFKKVNLAEYADENGILNFDKVLQEFMRFINEGSEVEDTTTTLPDKSVKVSDDDDDDMENVESDKTYEDYLREQLDELDKDDFRVYLIKILLGDNKGWGYIKSPDELKGDDFDVVTPKNAKKLKKMYQKANK